MRIVAGLRSGPNLTNVRTEALIGPLEEAGHQVEKVGRNEVVKGADLYVQTGFARSAALMSQIDAGLPYIIMEAPFWRDFYYVHGVSSWGYNGLAGGAWVPDPPDKERDKPDLLPVKTGTGPTIVIGQKPTDHSLRGSDHVKWLMDVRSELPEADFRPHPLMVPPGTLEDISTVLERYHKVVCYTSTVGADALLAGCEVRADHPACIARGVTDREQWLHDLGYDEARERARLGGMEIPRPKVDGKSVEKAYYAILETWGYGRDK